MAALAAGAALLVGLAYAAITVYWATGGTWLLSTVGGPFQRWGRSHDLALLALLWGVAVIKVVAAGLPVIEVRSSGPARARVGLRRLAWVEGTVLTVYGLALSLPELAVEAGLIAPGAHIDRRSLAWHAFLWDPWFALWGALVLITLASHRPRTREDR